jgi:hypothetical protein
MTSSKTSCVISLALLCLAGCKEAGPELQCAASECTFEVEEGSTRIAQPEGRKERALELLGARAVISMELDDDFDCPLVIKVDGFVAEDADLIVAIAFDGHYVDQWGIRAMNWEQEEVSLPEANSPGGGRLVFDKRGPGKVLLEVVHVAQDCGLGAADYGDGDDSFDEGDDFF